MTAGGPSRPDKVPEYDEALGELDPRSYFAALRARERWSPEAPGEIFVPLSAGLWLGPREALHA
jgi:hypothetical protein